MVFSRKGFRVERVVLFLFGGLDVLEHFNTVFYVTSGFIIFRILLSLRYVGVIFSSCRDL
jgi:hypothetical protein